MTATYYLTLTDHGAQRVAAAHGQAAIVLVNLVLGDAGGQPYDPVSKKNRTTLVNQRAVVPVQSVSQLNDIARVVATIDSSIGGFNIHEIGLTDSTGQLVYIGNYHGGYKPVLAQGASGELVILIDIKADAGSQILIQISPNVVTANKQWVQDNFVLLSTFNAHVAQNQLEHNNLVALITAEAQARGNADQQQAQQIGALENRLTVLANAIFHVGSWHGSNSSTYDPATALQPLFGYLTSWYLWPYVPAGVANASDTMGQIQTLQGGGGLYQTMTTRIWQRLADGTGAPSYTLSVSNITANEGQQLTFTLVTTGLPQGTPVDWNITGIQSADISPSNMAGQFVVGANGTATYTVSVVADVLAEGVETLVFALTYIPNKSVSVTINDSSKPNYRTETYLGNKSSAATHTLIVKPSETLKVKMRAAGGGSGSAYSVGVENRPDATAASPITLTSSQTPSAQINGGQPGTNGVWGTSSSYTNGTAGSGGVSTLVTYLSVQNGQDGFADINNHVGGGTGYGKGGDGANAIGSDGLAYGGGGGQGGYGEYNYTNNTGSDITFYLSIGAAGLANCLYPPSEEAYNQWAGQDGEVAQVIVEWNAP